jgi:hypothetical protein
VIQLSSHVASGACLPLIFEDYSSAFQLLSSLEDINENNSLFYMMSFAHARVYADTTSAELLLETYKNSLIHLLLLVF